MMTEKDLLDLKNQIEEAKENKTKLQTRREVLIEQLKDRFGVSTLKEAKEKSKQLQKELDDWTEKIDNATRELEAYLNEDE